MTTRLLKGEGGNDYKYINKQRIEMFPACFFKRDSCYN